MESLPALPEHNMQLLISQAIDKGVSVETLERLLAMAQQLDARHAKEQFNVAMASFQSNCPTIRKTKSVTTKTGIVAYRYAPIESIVSQVRGLLKEYNFSYAVETETLDHSVKVTCIAKHIAGHSESSSVTVPFGTQTQLMSDTQVVAAAITFAKRYAFCNAFGILTGDEDNDARKQDAPVQKAQFATKEQTEEIENLIIESQIPLAGILQQCKANSLQELTQQQTQAIIAKIERYIERKRKERTEYRETECKEDQEIREELRQKDYYNDI